MKIEEFAKSIYEIELNIYGYYGTWESISEEKKEKKLKIAEELIKNYVITKRNK